MSAPAARPEAVRRKVELWLADDTDDAEAIALHAAPRWDGEPTMTVGGVTVRIVGAATPLAARAALYARAEGERLVLLTELADDDLGIGLRARLSRGGIRRIDRWDLVRQVFGGADLDPRLVRDGGWAADALVAHAPPDGWPAPPGTVLTREHALRTLTAALLGLGREEIDTAGLLAWTTDARAVLAFTQLPAETVDGVGRFLEEVAGRAAGPILAAVRAGNGVDVLPLGLLAGVLWPEQEPTPLPTDLAVARARLEPWFGGRRFAPAEVAAFRDAAGAYVDRLRDADVGAEADTVLTRAEEIAAQLDTTALLAHSSVLPRGLTQRVGSFAAAVAAAVPADGQRADPAAVAAAQRAHDAVAVHRAATRAHLATATTAVRLLRWLAGEDGPDPTTLYDAVGRHVVEDGWVDRARYVVAAGDPGAYPALDDAYRRLYQAVARRRERHDAQFATLLAQVTEAEADPGALLRVEDVLSRVVQPVLDGGQRALLLVLDGMDAAAATALAESVVESRQWAELTRRAGARVGALAALPTVTDVSRCSLLSGRIATGGQEAERAGLAKAVPGSVLLHKADLRGSPGQPLDPEVTRALDDPGVPLVAVVLNQIDDALDSADPATAVSDARTVDAVRQLLARAQDRVVVVTSDHGHVVDRGADAVLRTDPGGGARWRPDTGTAEEGEVRLSGNRVCTPGQGHRSVVAPWREELRYGARRAGYHGGASPAEAVVPVLMFVAGQDPPRGWSEAPVASPAWWRPGEPPPTEPTAEPTAGPQAAAAPPPDAARPDLVAALLASDVYQQRRRAQGHARNRLSDERVAALVTVLHAHGGRAPMETLAARAGVPAHRIAGTVTALRRVLQVEGYPVVEIDPDGRTVTLDEALLREQFALDPSGAAEERDG